MKIDLRNFLTRYITQFFKMQNLYKIRLYVCNLLHANFCLFLYLVLFLLHNFSNFLASVVALLELIQQMKETITKHLNALNTQIIVASLQLALVDQAIQTSVLSLSTITRTLTRSKLTTFQQALN